MKIRMKSLLAALLVLSLFGGLFCGTVSAAKGKETGKIYLTVSQITFTLAGETEDIYVGTAPVEEIKWKSKNPKVVSVKDGVLTAVGAGTTTITADYGKQHWECTAGCLASDAEELEALSIQDFAAPKRLPPKTDFDVKPLMADAALIGDSITYIFYQNETLTNNLGHPLFLCRGGTSINGFLNHYKNLYFQGADRYLEDAVALSGAKKLFILLGQNDLGYLEVDETLKNYAKLLDKIRKAAPDAEIYIQSCAPEYAEASPTNSRNLKIYEFNARLPEFAEQQKVHLVDLMPYLENHRQRLAPIYSLDYEIHINADGCLVWGQVISNFLELEQIRGESK